MILIGLLHLYLFLIGFEEPFAKRRTCEPTKFESLDWDEFKWLYKQQD